jgi:hypothetical protein
VQRHPRNESAAGAIQLPVLVYKSLRVLALPLLTVLLTTWCVGATQRGDSVAASAPTQESLEASAAKFIKILRDKDVSGLASEFSRGGVYLGVDSTKQSYKTVVKSLTEKSGVYYVFFETELLNGKRDPGAVVSLRDHLIEAKSIKVHANIETEKGKIYGFVTIFAIGNPIFGDRGDDFCDVVYVREDNEWKIMNVEYL